jgi:hypothetical protein
MERRRKEMPREGPDILVIGEDGTSHQLNNSNHEEEDGGSFRISGSEGPDIWVNWEHDAYVVPEQSPIARSRSSSRSQSSPNSHFLDRTATTTPTSLPCLLQRAAVESPQTHNSSDHTFVSLCRETHSASVKVLTVEDRGTTLRRRLPTDQSTEHMRSTPGSRHGHRAMNQEVPSTLLLLCCAAFQVLSCVVFGVVASAFHLANSVFLTFPLLPP